MSMAGQIQEFPLPSSGARPDSVVRSADGDIWFTEFAAGKIGHLRMAGPIKEYVLRAHGPPVGIAAGEHYIWVTVPVAHAICRLGSDGSQIVYLLQNHIMPGMLAAGHDGNLWFTQPNGMVGRFSPSGIVDEFPAVVTARTAFHLLPEHLLSSAP
jgi:virginiamycin B lyase